MRMLSVGHLGLGGVVVAESAIATSRLAENEDGGAGSVKLGG